MDCAIIQDSIRNLFRILVNQSITGSPLSLHRNLEIPQPDKQIFENNLTPVTQVTRETQSVFWIDRTEYPPEGGIYIYKFGAKPIENKITPEQQKEIVARGNEALEKLKTLLEEYRIVLTPLGNKVQLVPLEIYNTLQPTPDLTTRIDLPYPEKGFVTPEAIGATNIAKKGIMTFIRFLPFPTRKSVERWIHSYADFADQVLSPYYLQDIRYTPIAQELKKFIETFLKILKIDSENSAKRFAKAFATLIEYDSAYRYRIEDILSETTKDKLLDNPRKEVLRLFEIFKTREPRKHLIKKFGLFVSPLSLVLWIPFVKKAFKEAVRNVDVKKMQLDEADRYYILRFDRYKFLGRTVEDRLEEYVKIHNGNPPTSVELSIQ